MGFKISFDEENVSSGEFTLVEEGKYEATIINIELKEYQGQYSFGFDVEIRSDVEQKHKGAKVLYNSVYLTSANPEYAESTEKKKNSFLAALGYSGKTQLDADDVVRNGLGKQVYVYIKHQEDRNDPKKKYPKVSFVAKSKVNAPTQNYRRVEDDPFANSKGTIDVSEDDLPF